jgi:hypothetical protein
MPWPSWRWMPIGGTPSWAISTASGVGAGPDPGPGRRPNGQSRPLDPVDRKVLDVARENPTDGTPMVAALTSR